MHIEERAIIKYVGTCKFLHIDSRVPLRGRVRVQFEPVSIDRIFIVFDANLRTAFSLRAINVGIPDSVNSSSHVFPYPKIQQRHFFCMFSRLFPCFFVRRL